MMILLCWQQRTIASLVGVIFYGASGMAVGLKMLIERQRSRIHEEAVSALLTAYSFPSGHTAQAAAFAFCLCWLVRHQKRTVQRLVALLGGCCRLGCSLQVVSPDGALAQAMCSGS